MLLRHCWAPVHATPQRPQLGDCEVSTHAPLQHRPARSPPRLQVKPSLPAPQVVDAQKREPERDTHSVPVPQTPPSAPQRATQLLETQSAVGHDCPQPPHAEGSLPKV